MTNCGGKEDRTWMTHERDVAAHNGFSFQTTGDAQHIGRAHVVVYGQGRQHEVCMVPPWTCNTCNARYMSVSRRCTRL